MRITIEDNFREHILFNLHLTSKIQYQLIYILFCKRIYYIPFRMFNTNVTTFKCINQLFLVTVLDPDSYFVPSRFGRYKVEDEIILSSAIDIACYNLQYIYCHLEMLQYIHYLCITLYLLPLHDYC